MLHIHSKLCLSQGGFLLKFFHAELMLGGLEGHFLLHGGSFELELLLLGLEFELCSLRGAVVALPLRLRGNHFEQLIFDLGAETEAPDDGQEEGFCGFKGQRARLDRRSDCVEELRQGVHELRDVGLVLGSFGIDRGIGLDVDFIRPLEVVAKDFEYVLPSRGAEDFCKLRRGLDGLAGSGAGELEFLQRGLGLLLLSSRGIGQPRHLTNRLHGEMLHGDFKDEAEAVTRVARHTLLHSLEAQCPPLVLDILCGGGFGSNGGPAEDVRDSRDLVDDLFDRLTLVQELLKYREVLLNRNEKHGLVDAALLPKRGHVINRNERVIVRREHPLDFLNSGVVAPANFHRLGEGLDAGSDSV